MNNTEMLDKLLVRMIEFDSGDPKRIQHFLKVHSYARLICGRENVDEHTRFLTEAAAIVHDIGIHRLRQNTAPAAASCRSSRVRHTRGSY